MHGIAPVPPPTTSLPSMRRLHLKLFYLRTRLKREAQGVTAKTLGVRPATMSHLEQGRSLPTLPMLLALCKHYDVTPSYLLDDERPIDPASRDRWSERDSVVARGNWLEVPEGAMVTTHDGVRLVAVQPGARFYDASAQTQRITCPTAAAAKELEVGLQAASHKRDHELEEVLTRELMGQRKPRSKPVAKSVLKSAMAQMPG
jgi:transcriptional regulator with XRE-family HTH domain